ncbi:MAG: cob(I)yrinic acid a,c-diamide adenosyltransferase [Candidatus Kariarchaeaceae archaeon]|jgi:cob(I)alamin adenosyltransferase
MKIYTGKGDEGKTSILGPERLYKDDIRIDAYGTIDELNSILGILITKVEDIIQPHLIKIQNNLFDIGSDLASEDPRNSITAKDVSDLEKLIDNFQKDLPELKSFILPGGSTGSSWLHLARTVTRRSERKIVSLSNKANINKIIIPWINRLSDLFFVLARYNNHQNGMEDIKWESNNK